MQNFDHFSQGVGIVRIAAYSHTISRLVLPRLPKALSLTLIKRLCRLVVHSTVYSPVKDTALSCSNRYSKLHNSGLCCPLFCHTTTAFSFSYHHLPHIPPIIPLSALTCSHNDKYKR